MSTSNVDTPEKLAGVLNFVFLLEKLRDGIITPDEEVHLIDVAWDITNDEETVEKIFTDKEYLIKLIQRFRRTHADWLSRETRKFPMPATPPTVPDDCQICYGPLDDGSGSKPLLCCAGTICAGCKARTEDCPFCRKPYGSPEKNPMLVVEKAKQQLRQQIRDQAIDEISVLLVRLYHADVQAALELTTKYYDFFETVLDILPEYEIEERVQVIRRFRLFVAALISRQRLEPQFYNEQTAVPDALAVAAGDDYEMWESMYLTMANFL